MTSDAVLLCIDLLLFVAEKNQECSFLV